MNAQSVGVAAEFFTGAEFPIDRYGGRGRRLLPGVGLLPTEAFSRLLTIWFNVQRALRLASGQDRVSGIGSANALALWLTLPDNSIERSTPQ